ncbi:MAG: hypothetical protein A2020_02655 [Lentisphaerae bacterium GWF2_45_14]|nr:MAG: hypothetical protein A2020_02655 [Lentisphaerae bacterium GWF2_45_14]
MVSKLTKKTAKPAAKTEEKPAAAKKQICEKTDLGDIKIHENVIGDVVRGSFANFKGAVMLEGASLIESIASMVGGRTQGSIGIDMTSEKLCIAVKVNIEYGQNVPGLSAKVQNTIREEIKKNLGLTVDKIDVLVQKLVKKGEEEEEETES